MGPSARPPAQLGPGPGPGFGAGGTAAGLDDIVSFFYHFYETDVFTASGGETGSSRA